MGLEKHLLVTIGEDPQAFFGLRFLGAFFGTRAKAGIRLTMFYTAPSPPKVWPHEVTHETKRHSQEMAASIEVEGRERLEQALQLCVREGFRPDMISKKMVFRGVSRIKDILTEGDQGLYDAVVLGRRGLSRLSELLDESLTSQMMSESYHFPLWVCRRPDTTRRGVLVCVDGSVSSLKIADHAGFMLAGEDRHQVTVCQVVRPGTGDEATARKNLDKAVQALRDNHFPAERISTRLIPGTEPAQAILAEAEKGRYAVVAAGQTGAGQETLRKLFFGSVSETLFRKLEGAVLWLCQ